MVQKRPKVSESAGSRTSAVAISYTHADNTTEQTALEVTGVTTPRHVRGHLDFTALTKDTEVRFYVKRSGGSYVSLDPKKTWLVASAEKGVPFDFRSNGDYKITVKSVTTEGATRAVAGDYSED